MCGVVCLFQHWDGMVKKVHSAQHKGAVTNGASAVLLATKEKTAWKRFSKERLQMPKISPFQALFAFRPAI